MPSKKVIFWFRQDLRISDNPGLVEAAKAGKVLPVYIMDTDPQNTLKMGGASKWWLRKSLKALQDSGVPLLIQEGKPLEVLKNLKAVINAEGIYWNRTYTPYDIARDKEIKLALAGCRSFNGYLLHEPWTVCNLKGDYYRVFTPYWKKCLTQDIREVVPAPSVTYVENHEGLFRNTPLEEALPQPSWTKKFTHYWEPGEKNAHKTLKDFVDKKLKGYKEKRDIPFLDHTSHLSPYLHFGEISPHQILQATRDLEGENSVDLSTFHSELGWREFSASLLYHAPHVINRPFQKKFAELPWEQNSDMAPLWKKGKTGYPIIDAGMRELWETGYMHNRVRMIVASFLTKHCQVHWKTGERHFWDTLVDADLASNVLNWQWVAGCGADAAPYFRIFNPVTQSKKFDKDAYYIRRWIPELKNLSAKQIHTPWI
tara:strand:- start:44 stop:1324 length:1281 start_codon:yes stop_codon:yes gene_type:complete